MDLQEARDEIALWTSFPSWRFEVWEVNEDRGILYLNLLAIVPDVRPPHNNVTVSRTEAVPYAHIDLEILQIIMEDMVRNMARHEVDEWLKRSGVQRNPTHQ